MTTPNLDPEKQLAALMAQFSGAIEAAKKSAYDRGFSAGVHTMKRHEAPPKGSCPHCRASALVWDGDPIPCGCRSCKCSACGGVCISASFPCEYAGTNCNPPSASEALKSAATRPA